MIKNRTGPVLPQTDPYERHRHHTAARSTREGNSPEYLRALNWPAVPVVNKRPARDWPNRATTDAGNLIRSMLHSPSAALAVHLGKAQLACLDVEGTVGGAHAVAGHAALADLEGRLGPLPITPASATPSGGRHYFFRDPGGMRCRVIGPGLEIRAGTALCCLPTGSRTPDRWWIHHPAEQPLADLPPAWATFLRPPPPPPPPPPIRLDYCTGQYAKAALEGELRTLASATLGGRNQALHLAAVRLGRLVGAGLLDRATVAALLERTAAEIGLHVREARPTINSGLKFGLAHPRELKR